MRSTEQRVSAVRERAKQIERARKIRRQRAAVDLVIVLSLLSIVGLSLIMPGTIANFSNSAHETSGMTASIFMDGGSLGYIVIGLITFMMGVVFTVLCYRVHDAEKKDDESHKQGGNRHD